MHALAALSPAQAAGRLQVGVAAPRAWRRSFTGQSNPTAAVAAAAAAATAGAAVALRRQPYGRLSAFNPCTAATPSSQVQLQVAAAEYADDMAAPMHASFIRSSSEHSEVEQQQEAAVGAADGSEKQAALPKLVSKPPRAAVIHTEEFCAPEVANGASATSSSSTSSSTSSSSSEGSSHAAGLARSSDGGSGDGSAPQRRQPQRKQQRRRQQTQADEEVVLAGKRYESILDVRFQMRSLQRQLLGNADEVEVPRDSPHFETIEAVFRLHPQRALKAADPIRRYFVVRNHYVDGGKGCEFQFEDANGRRDDFSLLKCTRPPARNSRRARLLEACAHAVAGQLAEVAAAAEEDAEQHSRTGALLCSRCGLDFKVGVAYLGWPLSKLVLRYRQQCDTPGWAPSKFGRDPQTQQAVLRRQPEADAEWARGWMEYHRQNARLAMLCKCCQGAAADARRAQRLANRRHEGPPGADAAGHVQQLIRGWP